MPRKAKVQQNYKNTKRTHKKIFVFYWDKKFPKNGWKTIQNKIEMIP